jgi:hypothetical protein
VRSANIVGPDSVAGRAIAAGCMVRGSSSVGDKGFFSVSARTGAEAYTASSARGNGTFSRGLKQRGLALATHPHLALKLRMIVAILLLHLCNFMAR